jgi:hypothetical protein
MRIAKNSVAIQQAIAGYLNVHFINLQISFADSREYLCRCKIARLRIGVRQGV